MVPLEPEHVRAINGDPAVLLDEESLVGWAELDGETVTGFGAVCCIDGVAVAVVHGAVRPWHHRYAVELLRLLDEEGVALVFAQPDPEIPGADRWMRRLGFEPTEQEVWVRGSWIGNGDRCNGDESAVSGGDRLRRNLHRASGTAGERERQGYCSATESAGE